MIRRNRLHPEEYAKGIKEGDISILSRSITLVESTIKEDQALASELLDLIIKDTGKSYRLGITGVPGVGKSTFIENFGIYLTHQGYKVAVLAVDPTSQRTRGSILGDKTRMEKLSTHPNAYIRPSAAGSTLGGVSIATRESMLLCEAAGFDVIIIETVGVGQSETAVRDMVDFFLLLMLAGAGDELQGIKRGIMEMADGIVINKADGENMNAARLAKTEYQTAVHYLPPAIHQWRPKVMTCSALKNEGIMEVWKMISEFFDHIKLRGWLEINRNEQNIHWLHEKINFLLKQQYFGNKEFLKALKDAEEQVIAGKISPSSAAQNLIRGDYGESSQK